MGKQPSSGPDLLSTPQPEGGYGARTARGAVIAMGGQVLKTGIGFAATIVMARLLAPQDFGLVAMGASVTAFCGLFVDLGLSTATLQRKDLDQNTVSALFFINVGAALVITLLVMAAAPIAAWGFGDDRVLAVCIGLALPIVFSGASAQHRALLQRAMRWSALQRADLGAQIAASATGIALAWGTGLGYWALVVQAWISAGANLALLWHACDWRPSRVTSWRDARPALGLGLNLTGFHMVNYFHREFDNVLIGWRYGATELGFYTRAYGLLLLPRTLIMWPISSSVVPALCRLQHEPERWRKRFLEALSVIVLVSSPLTAVLIAAARPLIILLFGPTWSEAVDIFQYLAISMFAATPLNAMGWLYVSTGRTDRLFRWGLLSTPFIVAAFFVGLPFGASGLALAYSSVICLALVPGLAFAARQAPIGTWDMLRAIAPATAVGIVSALVGLAARGGYPMDDPFADLVATSLITATVYAIGGLAILRLDPALRPLRNRIAGWLAADRYIGRDRLREIMARVSR